MVGINKPPRFGELLPSRSGATQNMASNIKVVVRVRPPNDKELELNSRQVVDVVDETMLVFDPKEQQMPFFYQGVQQPNRNFLKRANKELKFVFDHVCNQESTNRDVFEKTTKDILTSLMEGYNCSVFVYGATGAGKTFTMIGDQTSPGITYLTMDHLFFSINSFEKDREFEIAVSYLEVYNENVYDLLRPSKVPLQLREGTKYGVMVAGLAVHNIKTAKELLDMLENGNKNRTQHPTDANAESSRSHAVFQVYITMRTKTSNQVRMVKLSMIDLAGSERASATGCVGARFKEGANINRSLLSLGNCINKLADGSKYIPYRDSKLTRLLKDSLGGNCRTVMIANISPSSLSYEDTYNTLKYAARANKIQLSIKKNIVDGDMKISQYAKVVEELNNKIKELEAKLTLSSLQAPKKVDLAKEKAKSDWRRRISECAGVHTAAQSALLQLLSRQRILALRHRLRTRAFAHVLDLAHRSSTEAMELMCNEDIPRQERASESYIKQSVKLDTKILTAWNKWNEARKALESTCDKALAECPDLSDLIKFVKLDKKHRETTARDELRNKLLSIQNDEIIAFTNYMIEMPNMCKKLYRTLKGYDKVPPALTEEYLDMMRIAKSAKAITWSDDIENDKVDPHFKFISNLDMNKPTTITELMLDKSEEAVATDTDELTDVENQEPATKKRKGTPIKLPNNETIVIDDSFESLDVTRTLSAKKVKTENCDVENATDANLNSTMVLSEKIDSVKKMIKTEPTHPIKRGLADRTNMTNRAINFDNKAKIVKPIVGKAAPFRYQTGPIVSQPKVGFGSSMPRNGIPMQRNVQAVRARERVQTHPYSRPNAFNGRK